MKQLLATLLLVGLVVAYWPWVVGFVLIVFGVRMLVRRVQLEAWLAQERREQAAGLAFRADLQNLWVMDGDPRGTYGRYMPPKEMMML